MPALWIQGRPNDGPHDYRDPVGNLDVNEPERFVRNYRKAGGSIEMADVAQANRGEESNKPTLDFFRRHLT